MRARGVVIMAAGWILALGCSGKVPKVVCPSSSAIVVSTADHRLALCESGAVIATFQVALGRGGIDKRFEGDKKTPLGSYALGEPRPSSRFGTFIPIAYPTADQRRQGFTGTDVGIHGPERLVRWVGAANSWLDWTSGCIAVARDEDVHAIASFVLEHRPVVLIR